VFVFVLLLLLLLSLFSSLPSLSPPAPPPGGCGGPGAGEPAVWEHLPTELPSGFPRTEAEAKAAGAWVGCPEEVALKAWLKSAARGGRDAKDVPIRNWRAYLAMEATYERSRTAEARGRNGSQGQTPPPPPPRKPKPPQTLDEQCAPFEGLTFEDLIRSANEEFAKRLPPDAPDDPPDSPPDDPPEEPGGNP
ncbi:MAG: hypothetical protein ACKO3N_12160, partial [Verrucomicrobiota bacterium]